MKILQDIRRDGRVNLIIHELLHVWVREHFDLDERLSYELEEATVLALEKVLNNYLQHPTREQEFENWDRAIRRKIGA